MKTNFFNTLLEQHPLWLCMGPGGVGKTSTSATLAVAAASAGKKVLLLSLDPSKSLSTALNFDPRQKDDTLIPDQNFKGKLFASCIDAHSIFSQFLHHTPAQNVQNNRIYKQIVEHLPGCEDFSSLIKLVQALESQNYELIVLDTPPLQHSIDFLAAPAKFEELFASPLTRWLQKGSSHIAIRSLLNITSADFIKDISDFFSSLQHIQPLIRRYSQKSRQLLQQSSTAFVLVSNFDEIKLQHIIQLNSKLRREGCHPKALVLNRCLNFLNPEKGQLRENSRQAEAQQLGVLSEYAKKGKAQAFCGSTTPELDALIQNFSSYYQQQLKVCDRLSQKLTPQSLNIIKLPDLGRDINGLADLKHLGKELRKQM